MINIEKITPQKFFKAWFEVVHSKEELLSNEWQKAKEFTKLVIGSNDSLLSLVAQKLHPDLKVYEEDYYYIDSLFYFEQDRVPRIPSDKFWFRRIRIAFEHENFIKSVYQEFSHLLLVDCDLRVLVSYPGSEKKREEQLQYFKEIYEGSKINSSQPNGNEILVIFGYQNGFIWEGYILENNHWQKI